MILLFILNNTYLHAQIQITHTDVTCSGVADGTAEVTAVNNGTPPFNYSWSNGQTTASITGLAEGIYDVTVVDAHGCSGSKSVEIKLSMTTLQTSFSSTPESCDNQADGTATVSVSGGSSPYTYSWSNGGTSSAISSLSAGNYSVVVTDANGCKGSGSVVVDMSYNAFPVSITSSNDVSCNGGSDGSATASASGGGAPYTYSWPNGGTGATASGLKAGTHSVIATDAGGCHGSASVTISEPSKLNINISGGNSNISFCTGTTPPTTTLSAAASGGTPSYNYSWPGGSITVSNSRTYSCSVTDDNGCAATQSINIVFIPIDCPRDPNLIAGPLGYAEEQWVSVNDRLSYTTWFENDPEFATAPAQDVKITIPLSEKIDLYSLRIGDFGFGDFVFSVPSNTSYYTKRLDVRDSLNVYVDVIAGLDVVNKKAFWIFKSIDPSTGLPPNDPQTGFLPVNDTNTHIGEGFVTFSMQPKSTDITADSILAQAEIIFDINEPINTNQWFNVIDALPPSSTVNSLPAVNPTSFEIGFSGQDDFNGCGISKYQLYFSKDTGSYEVFGEYNAGEVAHFTGIENSTYRFFSIAKDHTGNTEPMKNSPDITTLIGYPKLITGTVTYQNNATTPMNDVLVYLKNTDETVVDSVYTNQNGEYNLGYKQKASYLIEGFADLLWGGVNSTDALVIRRKVIGLSTFNTLQTKAADISNSGNISGVDAFLIRKRIVDEISKFSINDWVFLRDTIKVDSLNINHPIMTLCAGDVNGSYSPVFTKSSNITLSRQGETNADRNQLIELPVICNNELQTAAVTFLMDYPNGLIKIENVVSSLSGFMYKANNGKLILAWDSLSPISFDKGDALFVMQLRINRDASEKDRVRFTLDNYSEFADKNADVIDGVSLSIPNINISPYLDYELGSNFPNPFSKSTEINYELPEEGFVTLKAYNILGQEIKTMVSGKQRAGSHTIHFDGTGLGAGTYSYKIEVEGKTRKFTASNLMIFIPNE